jgi:hypothetical protein
MAGHGTKFGRKQEEAIAALLTQRNVDEAARTAGIGTRTLLRWLQLPEFQKAYREARRGAFSPSIARLQQGASAAAMTLLKTMIDPNRPASTRIWAAECVLNHATKAIEIEDIEARGGARSISGERRAAAMSAVVRRIRRLEDQFKPAIEPDFLRCSRQGLRLGL